LPKLCLHLLNSKSLVDVGDVLVRNDLTVLLPVLAILLVASLKVTGTTMEKDDDEEHGVEVGDDGCGSDDGPPCEGHGPIGDVVGFAAELPPSRSQQAVAMSGLDVGWVFDGVPWDLREAFAPCVDALGLHLEVALLCHGRVPDGIGGENDTIDEDITSGGELVF